MAAQRVVCCLRPDKIDGEDMEILQLQQRNLDRYPDRKLLLLNIDAGGVRSRMMIDRAIAEETGATQAHETVDAA